MIRKATAIFILLLGAGCSNTLETGYKPTPLNSSGAVRRGYYASPFTPEAKAAEQDDRSGFNDHRPRGGY